MWPSGPLPIYIAAGHNVETDVRTCPKIFQKHDAVHHRLKLRRHARRLESEGAHGDDSRSLDERLHVEPQPVGIFDLEVATDAAGTGTFLVDHDLAVERARGAADHGIEHELLHRFGHRFNKIDLYDFKVETINP